MTSSSPYPLLFSPILLEKVWGGRRLAQLGKVLPDPAALYGESWEIADLPATSLSGAGGGAVVSTIANGPLKGKALPDAIELWGNALIRHFRQNASPERLDVPQDAAAAARHAGRGRFPLLVKFLDASENLSVQVHPSPAYATAHPDAHLKTECWYILAAEPRNATPPVIYKGLKHGISPHDFERAARAGDESIIAMLNAVPAVVGQCHDLPSGTVHALGAGVVVAEVQTPSDTTFRVYDWGRTGRTLHIDEAMQCIDFNADHTHPATSYEHANPNAGRATLAASPYYRIDELRVPAATGVPLSPPANTGSDACCVLIILEGEGHLGSHAEHFEPCACRRGQTWLIPAALMIDAMVEATADFKALLASLV